MSIVFPSGESTSRPFGEFLFLATGGQILAMQTVEETRRLRLQMLVEQHGGMAELMHLLGSARNETASLTRILNANLRHERGGAPYVMGSPKAREIEQKLNLEHGWMDTPPTHEEDDFGGPKPIDQIAAMFAAMEPEMQYKIVRMVDALTQPANGTNGQ